jgi:hypothetical protein
LLDSPARVPSVLEVFPHFSLETLEFENNSSSVMPCHAMTKTCSGVLSCLPKSLFFLINNKNKNFPLKNQYVRCVSIQSLRRTRGEGMKRDEVFMAVQEFAQSRTAVWGDAAENTKRPAFGTFATFSSLPPPLSPPLFPAAPPFDRPPVPPYSLRKPRFPSRLKRIYPLSLLFRNPHPPSLPATRQNDTSHFDVVLLQREITPPPLPRLSI